jgi:hypothetical protein
MDHLSKRQSFLIDQGYSYDIITYSQLVINEVMYSLLLNSTIWISFFSKDRLYFSTKDEQEQLLEEILVTPDREKNTKVKNLSTTSKKVSSKKPRHPLFQKYRK